MIKGLQLQVNSLKVRGIGRPIEALLILFLSAGVRGTRLLRTAVPLGTRLLC